MLLISGRSQRRRSLALALVMVSSLAVGLVASASPAAASPPDHSNAGGNGNGNANGHPDEPAAEESSTEDTSTADSSTADSSTADSSAAARTTEGDPCDQTPYAPGGNGANTGGVYDDTCEPAPSGNGNGGGNATGQPCAGCVGNADEKNPPGQQPGPQDHNNGYECDGNSGIAKTNPAHTGCANDVRQPPTCPPGTTFNDKNNNNVMDAGECETPGSNPTCPPGTTFNDKNNNNVMDAGECEGPGGTSSNPTCPEGTVFNDINGNGLMDAGECAAVAGASLTSPPAVLGVQLTRAPTTPAAAVLPAALPRTGADIEDSVRFAVLLLAMGLALVALQLIATRRRTIKVT